jgi:hypothetical protein
VVLLQARSVPKRDDLVADVLVDGSVPGEDDPAQVVEIHLDHLDHVVGLHPLRHRCEAADVDEEKRDLAALAAAQDVVHAAPRLGQLGHDLGLEVLAEDRGHLALLAVLIEEPVGGHAGVGETHRKQRMEQIGDEAIVEREERHRERQDDQRNACHQQSYQDR